MDHPMRSYDGKRFKELAGDEAEPSPSEVEMAIYSFLITRKPTREESRMAVRHLLREASRNLERSR